MKHIHHIYNLPAFFALSLLILPGCTNKSKNTVSTETDVETEAKTFHHVDSAVLSISIKNAKPISSSLEKIKVISFDEDAENIIGLPQTMEVRGDTIFTVDSYQAPGIYAYLMDGTQLWAYCSEGGADADIASPFNLSVTDNYVTAYDMGGRKLITLDKSGKFVKKTDLHPDAVNALMDATGGIWTNYSNQEYANTLLSFRATPDSEETEILEVPDLVKGSTVIGIRSLTPLRDGTINYLPELQPKVYSLYDGKIALKYILDFGSLWPDEATMKKEYRGGYWARNMRNFPVSRLKIDESQDWVGISFSNKENNYIYLYDRKNKGGLTYMDDTQEYYAPLALVDDTVYMQAKDNTIVALKCK